MLYSLHVTTSFGLVRRWPRQICLSLAVLWLCTACRAGQQAGSRSHVPVRKARLSFDLPRLGGGRVAFSGLVGNPAVIFLFTTWSLRSQVEASRLAALYRRSRGCGTRFVGVALDRKTPVSMIETYVRFTGIPFDVALAEPTHPALRVGLGPTRHVPRTLVLDARGSILEDFQGLTQLPRLERITMRFCRSHRRQEPGRR